MTDKTDDDDDSIAQAGLSDIFGALTLATPTWTIIRHPFRFDRYKTQQGAAIHYLYAAIGVETLINHWTAADGSDLEAGGDAASIVAAVNGALAHLGPNAKVDGTDVLPVMLLLGNLVSGFTAYFVCRWLARRAGRPPLVAGAAQTLAATAYFGGATTTLYGLFLLFGGAHTSENSPFNQVAGAMIAALLYFWGRWLRNIHGVIANEFWGALFPFGLAMLCLPAFIAVFYPLVFLIKIL